MRQQNIETRQDKVNDANSAFIFIINLFIIQGCQSGSVGRGGLVGFGDLGGPGDPGGLGGPGCQ